MTNIYIIFNIWKVPCGHRRRYNLLVTCNRGFGTFLTFNERAEAYLQYAWYRANCNPGHSLGLHTIHTNMDAYIDTTKSLSDISGLRLPFFQSSWICFSPRLHPVLYSSTLAVPFRAIFTSRTALKHDTMRLAPELCSSGWWKLFPYHSRLSFPTSWEGSADAGSWSNQLLSCAVLPTTAKDHCSFPWSCRDIVEVPSNKKMSAHYLNKICNISIEGGRENKRGDILSELWNRLDSGLSGGRGIPEGMQHVRTVRE